MIADRLRAAILQAAISGKLTNQRPEDGTATELLEQIKAERAALVNAKKLKKQKPLPPVSEEERPFALPSSWMWVRLGDYAHDRGQQAPQVPFTYIDISAIDNRKQTLDRANLAVLSPEAAPSRARRTALPGDVIYSTVRPYLHNACILPGGLRPEPIVSTGLAVLTSGHIVANRLLLSTMLSPYFDELANRTDNSRGVAYPAINDTQLRKLPVPVPPLAEQERIVAKLDAVLPLIDQLAELEREREHLDREFAKAIERAILQAAISGKLTKQHPEDGTATELLEQIKAERAALVKAKKLKKQKPLPSVDKTDEPFDLPDTWKWTRLGDLGELHTGKTPSSSISGAFGGEIPFVTPGDIEYSGEVHYNNRTVSEMGALHSRSVPPRSVMQVCIGGSAGKTALISRRCCFNQQINAIDFPSHVEPSFIYWHLRSPLIQGQIEQLKAGTATPLINKSRWSTFQIALPPLAEQVRIVAKLDRVQSLVRSIEELVS